MELEELIDELTDKTEVLHSKYASLVYFMRKLAQKDFIHRCDDGLYHCFGCDGSSTYDNSIYHASDCLLMEMRSLSKSGVWGLV